VSTAKHVELEALIKQYKKQWKWAAFIPEVPLLTEGATEFKRKLGLCGEDWGSKEAMRIWVIQTHSKKGLQKKDTKDRPKKKIQPETPNCVDVENWDW